MYDIFSPPVASRVYVYPTVAAYEVMRLGKPEKFQTLAGQLSGLTALPPNTNPDVDFNLAALYAFNALGKELIFSEDKMTAFQENFDQQLDTKGIPTRVRKASKEFAELQSITYINGIKKIITTKPGQLQNTPFKKNRNFGNQLLPIIWMELNPTGERSVPSY